ncbi:hypothetical protein DF016_10625 [Burkholderia stagnalis]|uniref:NusG domain-containing protein n=1 Tax=Burkholderia stagnalis TaxID=1503054 RepID=A0ABX9YQE3_9BURK|nr:MULTISPECIES: hypothetical protein [Burkholderia]MDD1494035.1 hypothetical protein [Burkholderia thailandensis]RQY93794.1 hypothetical protein DF017_12205 [Burkholderia stagnalis]RQZ19516.1 hypothetical protein DF016_10625 [Burkholderia stagnalis]
MQAIRSRLGHIEEHARAIAIGVTVVIVLITLALPYAERLARFYMSQAALPETQLVMAPEYRVLIDGHATSIVGTDVCPREEDPEKAYWMGGRPYEIPSMGCVVVGPATKEVRVQVIGGPLEAWKVVRRERNGLPETLLKRPNGEYVAQPT